jgi:hypothetical protein
MNVLAVLPDAWLVGFGIFQVTFSAAVSFAIWRLATAQRKYDMTEDRLHELATKLVDERFRAMTHEVNGHVQSFMSTLDMLKQQIQDGEQDFRVLGDRDQKIELAVAAKIDVLKDYIRDNAASKTDVKDHERSINAKLDRVGERIGELSERVAVLEHRDEGLRS